MFAKLAATHQWPPERAEFRAEVGRFLTEAGGRVAGAAAASAGEDLPLAVGVPGEVAKQDAEGIEHHLSDVTLAAFSRFLAGGRFTGTSLDWCLVVAGDYGNEQHLGASEWASKLLYNFGRPPTDCYKVAYTDTFYGQRKIRDL